MPSISSRIRTVAKICLLACGLASCVTPGTIEEQPWIEVTSEHFTLLSNASEKQTVELARDLERFRAAILKLTGSRDVDPKVPVRIHVLDDLFPAFRPGSLAVGYIVPTAHAHYIAIDANRAPDETRRIVFHEFVHFVLRNQDDPTQYPLWYDEGLAEMLGTGRITQAGFEIALSDRRRLQPLIDGGLVHETNLSLERIMTTRSLYGWHPALIAAFYNKAWAFTHFLHTAHLSEGVDYFQPMLRYLQLLDQGCEPAEALDRAFGSTYADLERRFHRYLTQRGIPAVRLAAEDLQASDRVSTRTVPMHEALYRVGDLARRIGNRELAADLFGRAQAANPAYALVYEGLAWNRAPQGDAEAQRLFARALELDPNDPRIHLSYADHLRDSVARTGSLLSIEERRSQLDRARSHYRRAIELAPELPAAHAGLGATYLFETTLSEEELARAAELLTRARAMLPSNPQTSLWFAALCIRGGGDVLHRRARELLEEILRRSEGESPLAAKAASMLAELDRLAQP